MQEATTAPTFTRLHVGYTGNGAPLYEYTIPMSRYVVGRTYPDRGRDGWTVYDVVANESIEHCWTLAEAKATATHLERNPR